jgi:hypothetical protein
MNNICEAFTEIVTLNKPQPEWFNYIKENSGDVASNFSSKMAADCDLSMLTTEEPNATKPKVMEAVSLKNNLQAKLLVR